MELWAVIVLGYSRHPVDAASNLSNHENFERWRIFTVSGVCFGGIDLFPSSRVERQKFKVSSLNLFSFSIYYVSAWDILKLSLEMYIVGIIVFVRD